MLFGRDVRIDYHIIYYIKSLDTYLLPKSMLCSKGEGGRSELNYVGERLGNEARRGRWSETVIPIWRTFGAPIKLFTDTTKAFFPSLGNYFPFRAMGLTGLGRIPQRKSPLSNATM